MAKAKLPDRGGLDLSSKKLSSKVRKFLVAAEAEGGCPVSAGSLGKLSPVLRDLIAETTSSTEDIRGAVTEIVLRIAYPDGKVKHMTIPAEGIEKIVLEGRDVELVLDRTAIQQHLTTKKLKDSWSPAQSENKPTFLIIHGANTFTMCPPSGPHSLPDT